MPRATAPRATSAARATTVPVSAAHTPRLSADERRAEIVDAAVKAFASGGLAGTSTEDIARLAGVSQPYVFRLFGTKKELFLAAVERAFDRVELTFAASLEHPLTDVPYDYNPVLATLGQAYSGLLADRSILRLQLHAYAACDDLEIQATVRRRFAGLIAWVSERSGVPSAQLMEFFAAGMLMNAAAAMDLSEAGVAWQLMCEGVSASTS